MTRLIRFFALLCLSSSALLAGCAGVNVYNTVSRFHELDNGPHSFALVPLKDEDTSLEYRNYAGLVLSRLLARGWRETAFDDAELAVSIQYAISSGRQVTFSYPIYGSVPTGTTYSTTTFNASSYGGYTSGYANTTTTQGSTFGVVGSGTGTRVAFDRALQMRMDSVAGFNLSGKMQPVYEGTVHSTGSSGVLSEVMPAMVEALFRNFPGASGRSENVTIPLKP